LKKSPTSCLRIPSLGELQGCLTPTTTSGDLVRAARKATYVCQGLRPLPKHLASRTNGNILHLMWEMERKSWKNHCPRITRCELRKLNDTGKSPLKQLLFLLPDFFPFQGLPCSCRHHLLHNILQFCRMMCNLFSLFFLSCSKYLLQTHWLDLSWPCSCGPQPLNPSQRRGNIQIGLNNGSRLWLSLRCLSATTLKVFNPWRAWKAFKQISRWNKGMGGQSWR